MITRFARLAAVAIVAAGTLGVFPAAYASAQAPPGLWLYEHDDFKGGSKLFQSDDCDLRNNRWNDNPRSGIVNNNASSMINTTGRTVILWDGLGCTGTRYFALPHSSDRDLTVNTNNPPNFDNKVSGITGLP